MDPETETESTYESGTDTCSCGYETDDDVVDDE